MSFRVGFCVSGAGRLCRAAVLHRETLGIEPALVVAEASAALDLDRFLADHRVRVVRLDAADRAAFDERLESECLGADLDLVSLTFDRIVRPSLVRHFLGRMINVHPSLLPAYAGMRGLAQAVEAGACFTGATVHEVDERVDHGPIVAQCVVGIRTGEDVERLGSRLYGLLRLMYLQVLAWYAEGRVTRDADGLVRVRDAVYGELPVSPAVERAFAD